MSLLLFHGAYTIEACSLEKTACLRVRHCTGAATSLGQAMFQQHLRGLMQPLLRKHCVLGNEDSSCTCLSIAMLRLASGMHYG